MLHWNWRSFQELSNQEIYDLLALRQTVFIVEQQCIYQDMDYRDLQSMHLLCMQNNKLVAYLRILPEGIPYSGAISFGRVLTAPFARRQGLAKALIKQTLLYLDKKGNKLPIIISAQLYLEKFYQAFGFETEGHSYDEDGIPHIKMRRI